MYTYLHSGNENRLCWCQNRLFCLIRNDGITKYTLWRWKACIWIQEACLPEKTKQKNSLVSGGLKQLKLFVHVTKTCRPKKFNTKKGYISDYRSNITSSTSSIYGHKEQEPRCTRECNPKAHSASGFVPWLGLSPGDQSSLKRGTEQAHSLV
jgi:hypothetical protein